MSNKLLSEEEVTALKASPHVESATIRAVTFTPEFKKTAYRELLGGKNIRDIFGSFEHKVYSRFGKAEFVKYLPCGKCEIIPDGIVKFSAYAESEIKFAHIRVSEYFTAKLFHSAKQNFTCPKGKFS